MLDATLRGSSLNQVFCFAKDYRRRCSDQKSKYNFYTVSIMRKLTFANVPPKSEKLSDGRTRVHYNVTEVQETNAVIDPETGEPTGETETHTVYQCEFVIIDGDVNVGSVVSAILRKTYSVDDELALLRQRDVKPKEFAQYNADAEAAKAVAHGLIND
jgi:hypothetical protein